MDVLEEVYNFCSKKHKDYVDLVAPYIDATEVVTTRNPGVIPINLKKFRYDREIILKDISYLFGDVPVTEFTMVQVTGVKKNAHQKEIKQLYVYEKGNRG